jgi:cytochrome c peroxidase
MGGLARRWLAPVGLVWLSVVAGCGGGGAGGDGGPGTPNRELAQLGEQIFDDPGLSEPPGLACASCHDPARGFADPRGGAVSAGAPPGAVGFRNAPSLAYAMFTPPFSAAGPVGGSTATAEQPPSSIRRCGRCSIPRRWQTPTRPR